MGGPGLSPRPRFPLNAAKPASKWLGGVSLQPCLPAGRSLPHWIPNRGDAESRGCRIKFGMERSVYLCCQLCRSECCQLCRSKCCRLCRSEPACLQSDRFGMERIKPIKQRLIARMLVASASGCRIDWIPNQACLPCLRTGRRQAGSAWKTYCSV